MTNPKYTVKMEEQDGNSTSYLFEFWLCDYEIEDLFQITQSYDGNL
jgi:hypothetical protein